MITAPIALGLGLIDFESAFDKDNQGQEGINVPTIPNQYTPLPVPELQFDTNNPDEIARNSSIPINVIGGCSPYTWSVSGNGFTLTNATTNGLTNTLNADTKACGRATIIVTDACGETASGYVKCTTGQWLNCGTGIDYGADYEETATAYSNTSSCMSANGLFRFTTSAIVWTGCTGYYCDPNCGADCFQTESCDGVDMSIAALFQDDPTCAIYWHGNLCCVLVSYPDPGEFIMHIQYWGCAP